MKEKNITQSKNTSIDNFTFLLLLVILIFVEVIFLTSFGLGATQKTLSAKITFPKIYFQPQVQFDPQAEKIGLQGNSDETEEISKDIEGTDFSNIDSELNKIEKELLSF